MVKTWVIDVRPLHEEVCYRSYYDKLPDFRKVKADRMRFQQDKALSVGAWMLLEMIRDKYRLPTEAAFNLSHSGDYALCSLSIGTGQQIRLGCDIEAIGNGDIKVAKRFFCNSEYRTIVEETDAKKQEQCFCRLWVLKESFIKATKEGMALELSSFEIALTNPPTLLHQPDKYPEKYYYQEYEMPRIPYKIAVCTTDCNIDSELYREFKF